MHDLTQILILRHSIKERDRERTRENKYQGNLNTNLGYFAI